MSRNLYSEFPRVRQAQFIPGMDTVPELEWLLKSLAFSRRHVEIGSFCGKSLFVSTGRMQGGEVYALDTMRLGGVVEPSDGWVRKVLLHTIGAIEARNPKLTVTFHEVDSAEGATRLEGDVDSVYIDANHNYEFVRKDIEVWLPRVRPGGLIAGHDFCREFPGVMQAVREAFGKDFGRPPSTRIWWRRLPG